MNKQNFEIKQSIKESKLIKDIVLELNKSIKSSKKDIGWFQYARYSQYGYKFLKNKEDQYEILEAIANKLAKKHKNFTTGQIVDMISELVNTRVIDDIKIHRQKIKKKLNKKEKEYLEKLLIEIIASEQYVPGYSWLMPTSKSNRNKWRAINLITGANIMVRFVSNKKYCIYLI